MKQYGVIFDMDGVLVDSYQAHFESWRRMLKRQGLELTEREFAETFGQTSREIIRRFFGGAVSEEDIARWDDEKEVEYREIITADFPAMDGAPELIAALSEAGFLLAIGSSGPRENVQTVLDHLPNARLFAASVNGQEVTHGKPDPGVFLRAAEKLELPPARCVVIEDALAGLDAAQAAGMPAIALTGTAPREALAEKAELVVDSLREVAPTGVRRLIDRHAAAVH